MNFKYWGFLFLESGCDPQSWQSSLIMGNLNTSDALRSPYCCPSRKTTATAKGAVNWGTHREGSACVAGEITYIQTSTFLTSDLRTVKTLHNVLQKENMNRPVHGRFHEVDQISCEVRFTTDLTEKKGFSSHNFDEISRMEDVKLVIITKNGRMGESICP